MIKAGIIGGAGYTAGELIRLLLNHEEVTIDFVFSTSNAGNPVSHVHQDLTGIYQFSIYQYHKYRCRCGIFMFRSW